MSYKLKEEKYNLIKQIQDITGSPFGFVKEFEERILKEEVDYLKDRLNYEKNKTESVVLTEFQKLVVECKPEINKPVFILTGVGCGKTFAFNERAKVKEFLWYTESKNLAWYVSKEYNNLKCGSYIDKFEEVVFEVGSLFFRDSILDDLIHRKKVIVCTNPIDFVEYFANRLKGEYTIISGYNIRDNFHLRRSCSNYEECLKGFSLVDRKKLYEANWEF